MGFVVKKGVKMFEMLKKVLIFASPKRKITEVLG